MEIGSFQEFCNDRHPHAIHIVTQQDRYLASVTPRLENRPSVQFIPQGCGIAPREQTAPTLLMKARWYLNVRFWKQVLAAVGIYSGTLSLWAYLVR